jgi:hypothetical protein
MNIWALLASVALGCPVAVCAVVAALVFAVDRDRRPDVIKDVVPVLIALVTRRRRPGAEDHHRAPGPRP